MSTSPQAESCSTSRPASPANEAGEEDDVPKTASVKLVEEQEDGPKEGRRRSPSVWKGLNLKRRMSKVNMKISNTLNDVGRRSSMFYHGPTEGTPLSPVELSPVSDENPLSPDSSGNPAEPKSDVDVDLNAIESSIVQSLSDLETSDCNKSPSLTNDMAESSHEHTANSSDQETCPEPTPIPPPRAGRSQGAIPKQRPLGRPMSQPHDMILAKRSDSEASEQTAVVKSLGVRLEGACVSRPTELTLFDSDRANSGAQPIEMDRAKRNRMQSVPNIKLSRQDTQKLKSSLGKDSSLANMFRRFSKYWLNLVNRAFYSFYFCLPGFGLRFCCCGVCACVCVC